MKLTLKKIMATVLCLITLFSLAPMQSYAATSSSCTLLSGSSQKSYTFKVKTGSRILFKNKLVFKQTKGSYQYLPWFDGLNPKTTTGYDNFTITVRKQGGKTQTYKFSGSSKTIKLDNNSTYTITVTPGKPIFKGMKAFYRWIKYPTWSITKVKGVATCR